MNSARALSLALLIAGACGGPQKLGGSGAACFRDDDCEAGLICVAPMAEDIHRVCSSDPTPLISMVEGPEVIATGGTANAAGTAGAAGSAAAGGDTNAAGTETGGSTTAGAASGGKAGAAGSGGKAGAAGSGAGGGDTAGTGGTDTAGSGGTSTAGTAADGGAPP